MGESAVGHNRSVDGGSLRRKLMLRLSRIPDRPGVYIFRDRRGRVLYVGKGKRLRTRVRSYFRPSFSLEDRKRNMVDDIADIDYMVTANEAEALILEYELITVHNPPFNIVFRDDKSYPLLKITREPFPRLVITRKRLADGARYFGPFTDSKALRLVLKALGNIVPLRKCTKTSGGLSSSRACINHEIGLCRAPCVGAVTEDEYREMVEEVTGLLRGDHSRISDLLEKAMKEASDRLDFERAASLRDQLFAFGRLKARQRIVGGPRRNDDVIAVARRGDRYCLQVISIRGGRLTGQRRLFVTDADSSTSGILRRFIAYNYLSSQGAPSALLLSEEPEDKDLLEQSLALRFGAAVPLRVPVSGKGYRLVVMALDNARMHLESAQEEDALESAVRRLDLPGPPRRIECFDISIAAGALPVASMVVFIDGRAVPAQYRRYRIRTVEGTDDFAMMNEAVSRRYRRVKSEGGRLPDLVLVDGGAGQVSAARAALDELDLYETPVFGLAKKEETIVGPGLGRGLLLPARDPLRRLFERIRDEAHRRAVGHHRLLRKKRTLSSVLDRIPGVGPALRRALLSRFGSIESIKAASIEELRSVDGVGAGKAKKIAAFLLDSPVGDS